MTACTICGAACPGTNDDDEACCQSCFTANLDGAELRPLQWFSRERHLPDDGHALVTQEDMT